MKDPSKQAIELPKPPRFFWGSTLIVTSILVTLGLWITLLGVNQDWYEDQFKYVAKIGSMSATILMCWAFLLATRWDPINRLFGGLDKVYKIHRAVGIAAFVIVFLHPIFLAMHLLPDLPSFFGFFWFSGNWVNNTGILVLLALTILVVLSIWNPLKYHKWKQTHNFFGIVLIGVVIHGFLGQGEIMQYPLLTAWFAVWIAVGLGSYAYIRLLYRWFGPIRPYRVEAVNEMGDVAEIFLTPEHKRRQMKFRPGQFLYLSFDSEELSAEPHPFTISSPPSHESIRLSVKELGDWTKKLTKVQPGEKARIWGPYGMFGGDPEEYLHEDLVMIGGGIGITPFLSMIQSRPFMSPRKGHTYLIYSTVNAEEAIYQEEIENLDLDPERFTLIMHFSDDEGFIDDDWMKERLGELKPKHYLLCGPDPMIEAITEILHEADVPADQIFKEEFDLV